MPNHPNRQNRPDRPNRFTLPHVTPHQQRRLRLLLVMVFHGLAAMGFVVAYGGDRMLVTLAPAGHAALYLLVASTLMLDDRVGHDLPKDVRILVNFGLPAIVAAAAVRYGFEVGWGGLTGVLLSTALVVAAIALGRAWRWVSVHPFARINRDWL